MIVENQKILLGQRCNRQWCIPCGHVEWDEPIEQAAIREFHEETGLRVELQGVAAVKSNFHAPHRQTVGVWFHGQRVGGELSASSDLIDVRFFPADETPPLAFPTDEQVISEYATQIKE